MRGIAHRVTFTGRLSTGPGQQRPRLGGGRGGPANEMHFVRLLVTPGGGWQGRLEGASKGLRRGFWRRAGQPVSVHKRSRFQQQVGQLPALPVTSPSDLGETLGFRRPCPCRDRAVPAAPFYGVRFTVQPDRLRARGRRQFTSSSRSSPVTGNRPARAAPISGCSCTTSWHSGHRGQASPHGLPSGRQ